MNRTYCVWLFLCLTATFLSSQPNPVPLINQSVNITPPTNGSQADPKAQARILDSYGKLPLSFEANRGQTDGRVKFLSRTGSYTLFLTGDEAVLALSGAKTHQTKIVDAAHSLRSSMAAPKAGGVLRMKLRNANAAAKATGMEQLAGTSNYFIGSDPKKWRSNVPTYAKVKYEGIYPGIDLVYYGNQRQLEYDFIVAPGADSRRIQFDVHGAKQIHRDEHGDLVLKVGGDEIRWRKPFVYQEKDGKKEEIGSHYAINGTNRVGFKVAKYDSGRPLYIDPLVYSTYLGGSSIDYGQGIAVDSEGNAYVSGWTQSVDFPTVHAAGSGDGTNGDAFVTKINTTGTALLYSTYLGGSGYDVGWGITVDGRGDAYVTGQASSTDFPVTSGAFQTACKGGNPCSGDAFVAELDPAGSTLLYSTYLGGSGNDFGYGIAVDVPGNAYVTGSAESTDFPTKNPFQPALDGIEDAFVTEINTTGTALVYSTYLGGIGGEYGSGITVDDSGAAYITGYTYSPDFPVTLNAFQMACNGGNSCSGDAFVTKFNATGSALVYSTYLGGSGGDFGWGIAVDSAGEAFVSGWTQSTDFPTMNPLQPTNGGGVNTTDAFVTKLNPTGSALVYSTYLGGNGDDYGYGIAVDVIGSAYVTGITKSNNFPTKNPLQAGLKGIQDAFVAEIEPTGSALIYSTYLGGSGYNAGLDIATDSAGSVYITGFTSSIDFPVTPNAFQLTCSNSCTDDAFVVKIDPKPSAAVTLVPSKLDFGNEPLGVTSTSQQSMLTNKGDLALTITSIQLSGMNSSDFAETNNCGNSVPPGGSCQISVTFTPSATGTRNAAVSITDNAPDSPQTISLSGIGGVAVGSVSPSSLAFGAQPVNTTSAPQRVSLSNTGDAQLTLTSLDVTGDFAIQTNHCTNGVKPGTHCDVFVVFTPTQPGARSGTLSFVDNATNSPQTVSLTGVGTSATTTTLTSAPNPSALGQAVTLTAVVVPNYSGTPTGTVTFFDGTTSLGTVTLNLGAAKLVVATLAGGTHALTGSYSGDAVFQPSTSTVVAQVVKKGLPNVTLGSSPNPSYVNQAVLFTATVSGANGFAPTGSVNFQKGTIVLSTVPLVSGTATYNTAFGKSGTQSIKAVYLGDINYSGKSSKVVKQVVKKYATSTVLSSTPNPSVHGQAVKFTATVTSVGPMPSGKVKFMDGTVTLGTTVLNGGVAILTKSTLAVGTHLIKAIYLGDNDSDKSNSVVLEQVVQ